MHVRKYVVAACAAGFFLSSSVTVGATNGPHTSVSSADNALPNVLLHSIGSDVGRFDLLASAPERTPFEKSNPEIKYIVVWPELPSISEQMVRIAYNRLREAIQEKEAAAPLVLFDWDRLWESVAGIFILAGLCCFTVVHGKWSDLKKKRI